MIVHLDTSAVVSLIRRRPAVVRDRLRSVQARRAAVGLSRIALFELWYGVVRGGRGAEKLQAFLDSGIEVLPFEEEDAVVSADLRHVLRKQPIGPYDLLIAAQALRAGATLVTGNVREFSRVPGLRVEDWTAPSGP